jgi:outer membrane lipoprotein-sorting protein
MLKELGRVKALQVVQKSTIEDTTTLEEPTSVNETVSYLIPGSYRSEFTSAAGDHIHVLSGGRYLQILNQRIVSQAETNLDRYKDIFLYNSREEFKNLLIRLGMAPDISSLGRYQGSLVYVLGAQYPDESVPQLWLDKNTFRPVRWLLRPASNINMNTSDSLEVRYLGWRKSDSFWYPYHVEIYQGNRLLRKIQVAKLQVNPKLSQQSFDITYLKSIYLMGDPLKPAQTDSSEKGEVQKTIERFRRLFE